MVVAYQRSEQGSDGFKDVKRVEQASEPADVLPIIELATGSISFEYRNNFFNAAYVTESDVERILSGIRGVVTEQDKLRLEEINAERKKSEATEQPQSVQSVLDGAKQAKDHAAGDTLFLQNDLVEIKNFFRNALKIDQPLSSGSMPEIFKLDSKAVDFITRRYKDNLKGQEVYPAVTNRSLYMDKDVFILSEKKEKELLRLVEACSTNGRVRLVEKFGDGIIVDVNGIEVVFLCPGDDTVAKSLREKPIEGTPSDQPLKKKEMLH